MYKRTVTDNGFVFKVKRRKEETRCVDMTVTLPVADTPRIVRNRQMREAVALGGSGASDGTQGVTHDGIHDAQAAATGRRSRRSSFGMRGKRMSSMGSGSVAGMPHESIQSHEFYRLIDAEQADPARMRQLLVWCAQRAVETALSSRRPSKGHGSVDSLVLDVQHEIIRALHARQINVSWYQRPVDAEEVVPGNTSSQSSSGKLPHPSNLEHAANVATFERKIAEYEKEIEQWQNMLTRHCKDHAILRAAEDQGAVISYEYMDILPHLPKEYVGVVHESDMHRDIELFVNEMRRDCRLEVHHLQDVVHKCKIAANVLGSSCESTYARMLRAFELRESPESRMVDPVDMLKLLAGPATLSA